MSEMNNLNSLVSYPRSGNTLLRFLIEYITERIVIDHNQQIPDSATEYLSRGTSLGKFGKVPKGSPIFVKYHLVVPELNERELIGNSKVNLIIRNYSECISSHTLRGKSSYTFDQVEKHIEDYCGIIKFFDVFLRNISRKLSRSPPRL